MYSTKRFLSIFSLLFIFSCSQPFDVTKEMLVDTGIEIDTNGDIIPPEEREPQAEPEIPPPEVVTDDTSSSTGNPSSTASSAPSSTASSAPSSAASSAQSSTSTGGQSDNGNNGGASSSSTPEEEDDDDDQGSSSSDANPESGNICDDAKLGNYKVDVCHHGKDINISINGWCNGHIKHEDDTLGKCPANGSSSESSTTLKKVKN